jgi:uncharacterized protein YlbG (UPF0298 family)
MKTNHDLKCICLFNKELSTSRQMMYVCMYIMYINIHQLIHQRKASSFVIEYQFSYYYLPLISYTFRSSPTCHRIIHGSRRLTHLP